MGLDVYLRKCADLQEARDAESAYERETANIYEDGVSDDARQAARAAASEKFGTDEWGAAKSREGIEFPSSFDPEHYFKVGYLRSSYNSSGINSVLSKAGIGDLYYIFGLGRGDDDGDAVIPEWEASLCRVDEVIVKYETFLRSEQGKYHCFELRPMHEYGAASEKEALDLFVKEMAGKRDDFASYSNREGEYWLNGMTVRAAITKKYERPTDVIRAIVDRPTVFLICDREKQEKEDWHLTALRIVRETIEYVLQQPDREKFYLSWSA